MTGANVMSKDKKNNKTVITVEGANVYLYIEDLSECNFELWEVDEVTTNSSVKVKIPVKTWKNIVKQWKNQIKQKK